MNEAQKKEPDIVFSKKNYSAWVKMTDVCNEASGILIHITGDPKSGVGRVSVFPNDDSDDADLVSRIFGFNGDYVPQKHVLNESSGAIKRDEFSNNELDAIYRDGRMEVQVGNVSVFIIKEDDKAKIILNRQCHGPFEATTISESAVGSVIVIDELMYAANIASGMRM